MSVKNRIIEVSLRIVTKAAETLALRDVFLHQDAILHTIHYTIRTVGSQIGLG